MSPKQNKKRIALYGQSFNDDLQPFYQNLIDHLVLHGFSLTIYQNLMKQIAGKTILPPDTQIFSTHEEIVSQAHYMFSIGGDGTFLNTIPLIRDSGIPVLGFNTGRLGFLSSISRKEIHEAIGAVSEGNFVFDERKLLHLEKPENIFASGNFALNEITVHKKESASMINIHAYVNDIYLNTYWADGLIVATPTGSTAYSLSCGGPILMPGSGTMIITPIAPHNLTVRPIVIPDNSTIRLRVEGRSDSFLVSLDSYSHTIEAKDELIITQSRFCIRLIQLPNKDFFTTIREKLMWGQDKRN